MKNDGFKIVEIGGGGCANCYSLMQPLLNIAEERGIGYAFIDAEEDAETVKAFQIERVPTVLILKDGKEIARCSGYQPEEILEIWIDAKIEENL